MVLISKWDSVTWGPPDSTPSMRCYCIFSAVAGNSQPRPSVTPWERLIKKKKTKPVSDFHTFEAELLNVICFCIGFCSSFCAYGTPLSWQSLVFFGREDRMTSTGVVITMRTLLSPDYTDSSTKKSNNMEKIQKGVAREICKNPQWKSYLMWFCCMFHS